MLYSSLVYIRDIAQYDTEYATLILPNSIGI